MEAVVMVVQEIARRWRRSFLSLFFRLLYGECAWAYDAVAWVVSLGRWRAWGRAALRHLTGPRILELAHGPGHLMVAMARQGYHPVGLDLSPNMGRLAHRRLRRAGVRAPLVRARAQALPFRNGSFDSVVATFPTEFIVEPATLREGARVLRRGQAGSPAGRFVAAVSVRLESRRLMWRLLRLLYRVTGESEEQYLPVWESAYAAARQYFTVRTLKERVGLTEVVLFVGDRAD